MMNETLPIMAAGLGGVFGGMTLLYIAIRITSAVVDHFVAKAENDG